WSGPTILKPSLPTRTPSASSSSQVAQRSRSRHRALLQGASSCRRTTAARRHSHPLVAARTKECSQAPCRSPHPGHATSRVEAFPPVSCVGGERAARRRRKRHSIAALALEGEVSERSRNLHSGSWVPLQ